MHIIRPLPVEYIVSIAETLRGRAVVVDGYDGAALIGSIAELAARVEAYRPHLYTDWDTAEGMAIYVARQLSLRGIGKYEVYAESSAPADWSYMLTGLPSAIVIDPGPDQFDVAGRVRAALAAASLVVVIDQAGQYTEMMGTIISEQAGAVFYGQPPVVYVLGRDSRAIIQIGA